MALHPLHFRIPPNELRQIASSVASVVGIGSVVAATFAVTHWTGRGALEPARLNVLQPYSASPLSDEWATTQSLNWSWERELTIYVVSGMEEAQLLEEELSRASNVRAVAGEPPFDYEVVVLTGEAEQATFEEGHRLALQFCFENGLPPIRVVDFTDVHGHHIHTFM
jgi:hypothetical protein